jgi:hypothetical protein
MPLYLMNIDGVKIPLAVDDNGQIITSPYSKTTLDGGAEVRLWTFNGTTWERTRMDGPTHTLQIIDYAHHEIHAGSHFFYTDSVTLNSGQSQDYLLTISDTTRWPHFLFDADGTAVTAFYIYEGADRNGSTPQTIFNSDRNSARAATMTIHKGTAGGSTDGTLIYTYSSGATSAQSRSPSISRNDGEIIFRQNTKYIFRVTSGTNTNLTNVRFEWYEHVNK